MANLAFSICSWYRAYHSSSSFFAFARSSVFFSSSSTSEANEKEIAVTPLWPLCFYFFYYFFAIRQNVGWHFLKQNLENYRITNCYKNIFCSPSNSHSMLAFTFTLQRVWPLSSVNFPSHKLSDFRNHGPHYVLKKFFFHFYSNCPWQLACTTPQHCYVLDRPLCAMDNKKNVKQNGLLENTTSTISSGLRYFHTLWHYPLARGEGRNFLLVNEGALY